MIIEAKLITPVMRLATFPLSSKNHVENYFAIEIFRSHIDKCSAGNGIFFVLFDVSIMIIRNNMILRRWGSIYLDKYEEEDFKIRRGKPLYLSETRFNILEKIWISSAFPRFVSLRKTTPK